MEDSNLFLNQRKVLLFSFLDLTRLCFWGIGVFGRHEFELQSRYNVYFWINIHGEVKRPIIPLAMGCIVPLLFF